MDAKVINLGRGDGRGVGREPVDLGAWHLEGGDLAVHGLDRS